ncbi:hypothetical protein ACI77J_26920 [Pseudomonas sp. O64]
MKLLADEVYVISGNLLSATPSLTDTRGVGRYRQFKPVVPVGS